MFINWAHFIIPKFFFIFSFIANPTFIYLIHSEKVFQFGDYRYLLNFFASFNMSASLYDILVPLGIHTYRYASAVFITDGLLADKSRLAEFFLSYRCAFIGGTYRILNSHFIYRYMVLQHSYFVNQYFMPHGLAASAYLVFFHIIVWGTVMDFSMDSGGESRNYVRESFETTFGNMENVNLKIVVFSETSPNIVFRSWIGTVVSTLIASYSLMLYVVLGYKIMTGLNKGFTTMSHKTTQMQKRLFLALSIQASIPVFVSFMPCAMVLYGTAFQINYPSWVNWISCIAISTFPVLDPMAIIMCLPPLRYRLLARLGIHISPNSSNQIQTITSV